MTYSGYIAYDAQMARLEDQLREFRRFQRTRTTRKNESEPVGIRHALAADRAALERLAGLDSADVLTGEVLIAEVHGEARAAIEIAGGATVADPFRRTAHLVELLRSRAQQERAVEGREQRRFGLRLRTA